MKKQRPRLIANYADLLAHEEELDRALCGFALTDERESRFEDQGAHGVAPSHYFVLEELFSHCPLDESSHLLDVGCSTGRVLAYFLRTGQPGCVTGVELDPELAAVASSWTAGYPKVEVLNRSALDLDLDRYTHFFMFNPFAPNTLQQFIELLEQQMTHPCIIIHMSDNGDTWHYVGREGWTEIASGAIQFYRNARGYKIKAYDCPQHYTIWRLDGTRTA